MAGANGLTAIIQARVGSTRLPNKIFADIAGHPLVWHVVERLKWSKRIAKVVMATTTNPKDDALERWCAENGVDVFRGSEEDVLSRYHGAAKRFGASAIVRVTADDPFKDPQVIDRVADMLFKYNLDFAYNNKPPSFPEGLDTEIFTIAALEKAQNESRDPFEREHVTQYLYRHPELFKQMNLSFNEDISWLRWTIDNQEDLDMARAVYNMLYSEGKIFLLDDILALLKKHPEISRMNQHVKRSAMYAGKKAGK